MYHVRRRCVAGTQQNLRKDRYWVHPGVIRLPPRRGFREWGQRFLTVPLDWLNPKQTRA
jgi:hypothetical protein